MKSAEQYLREAIDAEPSPYDYGDCEQTQAVAAIEAALADQKKYYTLLMAAIRRSKPQPETE